MRIGSGYDIHRLGKGKTLFLGGIEIPFSKGFIGHSDGDVLIHSLCDAFLSAACLGDIGDHFPDNDLQYKNISSLIFLERVNKLLSNKGYKIINISSIIIAEQPKLSAFKPKIKEVIAKILNISKDCINIGAKTQEGIGCIGNGEAIAAFSTVLIE